MAINSVTDLRNTDPGQTAFTVRQNPVGRITACHAVQITQGATSGDGCGINVVSNNTTAPAIRTRAAGPLIQLCDDSGNIRFAVSNTGAITLVGGIAAPTLESTGTTTVGTTLTVNGTANLNAALNVTGYTTFAGAQANGDFTVFGAFSSQANIGFYGTTPVVRQTVTGSRGANAALASLLTALAATGLITDSTSA